jgi:hypothetical protein
LSKIRRTDQIDPLEHRVAELGIKIVDMGDDPLFQTVELPTGFRIEPAEHPMYSYLMDPSGEKVATIFYKAAFYDRSAHIYFEKKEGSS